MVSCSSCCLVLSSPVGSSKGHVLLPAALLWRLTLNRLALTGLLPNSPSHLPSPDAREEEARRDAQFDYYPSSCHALGFGYRPLEIVGEVPDPSYVPPPPPPEQQPAAITNPSPVRPSPAQSPPSSPAQSPPPSPPPTPSPANTVAQPASPPPPQVHSHHTVASHKSQSAAHLASLATSLDALARPSPSPSPLPTAASPVPPLPPQRQQLEAASERLRRHLLDLHPSVVYVQVAVAAAVAGLLLWQRGKRRPGSPWPSPRSGLSRQPSLPLHNGHSVRSPRASPVKSPR